MGVGSGLSEKSFTNTDLVKDVVPEELVTDRIIVYIPGETGSVHEGDAVRLLVRVP
jgi:hypothetical protein